MLVWPRLGVAITPFLARHAHAWLLRRRPDRADGRRAGGDHPGSHQARLRPARAGSDDEGLSAGGGARGDRLVARPRRAAARARGRGGDGRGHPRCSPSVVAGAVAVGCLVRHPLPDRATARDRELARHAAVSSGTGSSGQPAIRWAATARSTSPIADPGSSPCSSGSLFLANARAADVPRRARAAASRAAARRHGRGGVHSPPSARSSRLSTSSGSSPCIALDASPGGSGRSPASGPRRSCSPASSSRQHFSDVAGAAPGSVLLVTERNLLVITLIGLVFVVALGQRLEPRDEGEIEGVAGSEGRWYPRNRPSNRGFLEAATKRLPPFWSTAD